MTSTTNDMRESSPPDAGLASFLDALKGWRELISHSRRKIPKNRHGLIWRFFIGFWGLQPMAAAFTMLIVGGALHGRTLLEMSYSMRMCFVFIIVNYAVRFWAGPGRANADRIMLRLMNLATRLAPFSENKVAFHAAASSVNNLLWWAKFYVYLDVGTLVIPLVVSQDELEIKMWPWPSGRLWVTLGGALQCCLGAPFAFPSFVSVALVGSVSRFTIALYDVLAEALRSARTAAGLKQMVILDAELTDLAERARDQLATLTCAIVACVLSTPLLSAMMAIQGNYDLFTIASVPYLMIYILVSTFSEDLKDACGRVANGMYNGHWLEVSDRSRRALVIMLLARRSRPLCLKAGYGIGVINLRVCSNTLQSWYSFLQVLLKVL